MQTVVDPVCKMDIKDEDAAATSEYMGVTYYFYSEACKEHFEKDPLRFLMVENVLIPPGK